MEFTIRFEKPMDQISAGAFGRWLDAMIRACTDHGPFKISYRSTPSTQQ